MNILVIAEFQKGQLNPVTNHVVAAAKLIGNSIDVLVAGTEVGYVARDSALIEHVSRVLVAENACYDHQLAENMAALIARIGKEYSHILAPASTQGKNYLPRAAAMLDVEQLSEVIAIESADTFKRPFYAGNAIATVQSLDPIKVMTIRGTAFNAAGFTDVSANIESLSIVEDCGLSTFENESIAANDRPDLASASIVIAGGRGMQNGENFGLLNGIADKLGAAVGASRAAVDAGFVSNDIQVGQTGKIVAPELYVAVGISGAIQHLAGMKDSKVIVAINKDEDAPIFQVADYGLVEDLFAALPELEQAL